MGRQGLTVPLRALDFPSPCPGIVGSECESQEEPGFPHPSSPGPPHPVLHTNPAQIQLSYYHAQWAGTGPHLYGDTAA